MTSRSWENSLFSKLLLSLLQLHTKIRASHYLVNIMEAEVQLVSSNIEKAFKAGPLEAILVIFGRRALIFFV